MSLQNNKKNHNINFASVNAQLNALDVLRALGYNDELRMSDNIRLRCIIHGGNKQNSLVITPGKNIFVCHSCDAKGDLIELYAQSKNIETRDAAFELASLFNIDGNTTQREKPVPSFHPAVVTTIDGDIPAAVEAWNKAESGYGHPYLFGKGVGPCDGLKYGNDEKGNHSVVIPFRDIHGHLRAIQYVNERAKNFTTGSKFSGAFFHVGDLDEAETIYITEGIATMLTVWNARDMEQTVVMCGGKTNMLKVVEAIRSKYIHTHIIVCLERDANDPKGEKMKESLKHIPSVSTVMPKFPEGDNEGSDFNDLQVSTSIDEVRKQLQNIEALTSIEKKQSDVETTHNKKHDWVFENNSEKALIEELKNTSQAISTGYRISDTEDKLGLGTHLLKFPGASLTIIAAATGHGKTTALINFSQGIINSNPGKSVYFFSYEESRSAVLLKHLNTAINLDLSSDNKASIDYYFRENTLKFITTTAQTPFLEGKKQFFTNFINNGILRVHDKLLNVKDLIEVIEEITKREKERIGAIFIDYIQFLHLDEEAKKSRQEELKLICLFLSECAKKTGLPFILAAQFNRNVTSLESIHITHIGEAGDIERIAGLTIGVWNHKDDQVKDSSKLTLKCLKFRNNAEWPNVEMVFDGNRGTIKNKVKQKNNFD